MVKYYLKKGVCVRIFAIFLFLLLVANAKEYYAKVEPLHLYTIASEVQGKVLQSRDELLGKKLSKTPFIVIDTTVDEEELRATLQKIDALGQMIEADKRVMENLQKSIERKVENYERIKDLSVKSKTQKDAVYFDLIATKNQLLATQKEIENFKSQLADLQTKKVRLQKSIRDKHVGAPGLVLYELMVNKGDVVNIATPLAKVADTHKGILTFYVDAKELDGIEKKQVYIDGRPTSYRVQRVLRVADGVNLSKYKVQIVIDPPKIFSKLVKVELK